MANTRTVDVVDERGELAARVKAYALHGYLERAAKSEIGVSAHCGGRQVGATYRRGEDWTWWVLAEDEIV